ncbi:MAG: hypothetical protein KAJ25_07265 [Desulfobacula sp.]|nr:hypothetical protein [Desulfobacula sp.]
MGEKIPNIEFFDEQDRNMIASRAAQAPVKAKCRNGNKSSTSGRTGKYP